MGTATRPLTQAEILLQVMTGGEPALPQELAQWILAIGFTEDQQARMLDLAERNNAGDLSSEEREEMSNYAFAGNTLSLWKSKARLALRNVARSA